MRLFNYLQYSYVGKTLRFLFTLLIFLALYPTTSLSAEDQNKDENERFSNFEIRVIRPRFFSKQNKFELGIQVVAITNQTFIYTYMLSGLMTYHMSEQFGIQVNGLFGSSIDKDDKNLLDDEFNIKTQIIRTSSIFGGSLVWTPMYGKYQLSSGRLIYFDTYLSAGGGVTGVDYHFDHCGGGFSNHPIRSRYIKQYPTLSGGIGQRFFISRRSNINWDLKFHVLEIDANDGTCVEGADLDKSETLFNNLTMHLGYSRFF